MVVNIKDFNHFESTLIIVIHMVIIIIISKVGFVVIKHFARSMTSTVMSFRSYITETKLFIINFDLTFEPKEAIVKEGSLNYLLLHQSLVILSQR
jgi:hypothetical protein